MNQLFAINGVWLRPPDGYQEINTPVVGYNLRGEPIRQGYPSLIFTWSIMKQHELDQLLATYNPQNPRVQVTYINRQGGGLITQYAMMEEPVIGARYTVYYQNVAVKFTRFEES